MSLSMPTLANKIYSFIHSFLVSSQDLYYLSQGISHGMWLVAWGRVERFSFFDCSSPFYFLFIELHYAFSISNIMLTCLVCYYYIWLGFDKLYSNVSLQDFYCSLPRDQSRDVTPLLWFCYSPVYFISRSCILVPAAIITTISVLKPSWFTEVTVESFKYRPRW